MGGLWDSNANAGPDSTTIRLFGFEDAFLSPEGTAQSDYAAVAAANVTYVYDLGTQGGDTIETNLSLYGSRYREQEQVNIGLIHVDVGPRFMLELGDRPASVRPFFEGSALWLGDDPYRTELGGGLNGRVAIAPRVVAETTVRAVEREYRSTSTRPNGDDQSGTYINVRPGVTWQAARNTLLSLDLIYGHNDANETFEFVRGIWRWDDLDSGIRGAVRRHDPTALDRDSHGRLSAHQLRCP